MVKGESERARADERRRREQANRSCGGRVEALAVCGWDWRFRATPAGSALHTRAIALMQTDESTDQDDQNRDGGAGKGRSSCEWVPTLRCDSGANLTRRVKLR
jgi:hypothetical protein